MHQSAHVYECLWGAEIVSVDAVMTTASAVEEYVSVLVVASAVVAFAAPASVAAASFGVLGTERSVVGDGAVEAQGVGEEAIGSCFSVLVVLVFAAHAVDEQVPAFASAIVPAKLLVKVAEIDAVPVVVVVVSAVARVVPSEVDMGADSEGEAVVGVPVETEPEVDPPSVFYQVDYRMVHVVRSKHVSSWETVRGAVTNWHCYWQEVANVQDLKLWQQELYSARFGIVDVAADEQAIADDSCVLVL
jgi:hypothetical protein